MINRAAGFPVSRIRRLSPKDKQKCQGPHQDTHGIRMIDFPVVSKGGWRPSFAHNDQAYDREESHKGSAENGTAVNAGQKVQPKGGSMITDHNESTDDVDDSSSLLAL